MAGIRLSPADINDLMNRLDTVADAAQDLTEAWPEVGRIWAQRESQVFDRGRGWAPLSASTLRRKRGISSQPLVRTGSLLAAATSAQPVRSGPLYAVFGVEGAPKSYAHWHQRGAGVPERQPVPKLTAAEKRAMAQAIGDAITRSLR